MVIRLVIEIKGEPVELGLDEARELLAALRGIFEPQAPAVGDLVKLREMYERTREEQAPQRAPRPWHAPIPEWVVPMPGREPFKVTC